LINSTLQLYSFLNFRAVNGFASLKADIFILNKKKKKSQGGEILIDFRIICCNAIYFFNFRLKVQYYYLMYRLYFLLEQRIVLFDLIQEANKKYFD